MYVATFDPRQAFAGGSFTFGLASSAPFDIVRRVFLSIIIVTM